MVYCTKCGAKNADDSKICTQCGASLYAETLPTERRERRRHEEECFGIPRGGTIVGLAIGVIIILWGGVWVLQQADIIPKEISVWPFAIIMFGILIIIGAVYGLSRRY
ncbi:MAG: zinc ribbon domain-containing protein [Candidatus Bathyarchaeota archaeon]|nr:MAG: zinc ribbon domain-containing protein [Candidatus Bathyarchaeota archaeon]